MVKRARAIAGIRSGSGSLAAFSAALEAGNRASFDLSPCVRADRRHGEHEEQIFR
jgi:hypothetical protein